LNSSRPIKQVLDGRQNSTPAGQIKEILIIQFEFLWLTSKALRLTSSPSFRLWPCCLSALSSNGDESSSSDDNGPQHVLLWMTFTEVITVIVRSIRLWYITQPIPVALHERKSTVDFSSSVRKCLRILGSKSEFDSHDAMYCGKLLRWCACWLSPRYKNSPFRKSYQLFWRVFPEMSSFRKWIDRHRWSKRDYLMRAHYLFLCPFFALCATIWASISLHSRRKAVKIYRSLPCHDSSSLCKTNRRNNMIYRGLMVWAFSFRNLLQKVIEWGAILTRFISSKCYNRRFAGITTSRYLERIWLFGACIRFLHR
jgi:hypothetical protein